MLFSNKIRLKISVVLCVMGVTGYAIAVPYPQDDKNRRQTAASASPVPAKTYIDEDSIPDSLLHTRWKVQRTTPLTYSDLRKNGMDLQQPDNLKQNVVYNDTLNRYVIGSKIGNSYINAPIVMTPEEYFKWSEKEARNNYFRTKNDEIYKAKLKEKFDFSDMHFDLGPA